MSVISGSQGSLTLAGGAVNEVTKFELNLKPEHEARRTLGNDHVSRDFVGYDYTISVQAAYDYSNTAAPGSASAVFQSSLTGSDLVFVLKSGNDSDVEQWAGTAKVTDITVVGDTGALLAYNATLEGDSAITYTNT